MTSKSLKEKQLFILEFNELCPSLLSSFMAEGTLPNFRRLYETSTIYTTDAEEPPPNLEPWIQWATIHSGLSFAEHGAFHLGDGRKLKAKCLAEVLSDAGIRVGVFGSMNTNYTTLNGYYIPDPWDTDGKPQPELLGTFFRTVSQQVQDASKSDGLSKRQLARFGAFMLRRGLRWCTIKSALQQLLSERRDPGVEWRRASLLEQIQYDLFRYLDRVVRPQFCTFFCNSTAHYQHYYWRNMHPEIFVVPPDAKDHPSLQTAIRFGYQQMDQLVGQFITDFPRATLVLCTALSQQPWTETTKCTYRPSDFAALLAFADLSPQDVDVKPVMAEEFHLIFPDEASASAGHDKLAALKIGGTRLLKIDQQGRNIFTGCVINDPLAMQRRISGPNNRSQEFRELFHMVHSMRSGRHHPDGVLWIRDGRHQLVKSKVALIDIAPTILQRFNVPCPKHMGGSSLDASWKVKEVATIA